MKNCENIIEQKKEFIMELFIVSDSHLGLMLSLDWFQPYDGTMVSFMQQFAIYRETSGIQQHFYEKSNVFAPYSGL
ncbi:hypothetical protein RIR_jg15256.t1 [Rhizophagus irregularis DAOM 181602=DAOM 197198]|nr:hypothetical protein RIR_jg15256.t1 [Rhizophagus irregularis DAOM 181602=DAOM 197198]